jgi:mannitol/fructose-specific phosphotransferase system IIA component (Ntr-type)
MLYPCICKLIENGDVYNNIKGKDIQSAFDSFLKVARLKKNINKKNLAESLLEREALCTTALAYGFAIPHPRKRIFNKEEDASLCIAYLEYPIEWYAPDGGPVATLFFVLSGEEWQHLSLLSEIATLVDDPEFRSFMSGKPQKKELLDYLSML